jgi:TRAP-type uncharacterized transport system substrate-binding protein
MRGKNQASILLFVLQQKTKDRPMQTLIKISAIAATVVASIALGGPASAQNIYTGGKAGAYFGTLCPGLLEGLRTEGFTPTCVESAGSLDNIQRLLADPTGVAMVQTDAFANWAAANPQEAKKIVAIRSDLASEGVYFVSKNVKEFPDVVRLITRIKIVLPPKTSGAAQTWENLKQILPRVFAKVDPSQVTYAENAAKAVDMALASDNTIALFVQLPDPENQIFKTIVLKNGNFVPLAARAILTQKVGDQQVYALETRPVTKAGVISNAVDVTTIATPILLITQATENVPEAGNARVNHEDLIKIIKGMPKDKLLPKSGATVSLFNRAFTASAEAATKLTEKAEQAINSLK